MVDRLCLDNRLSAVARWVLPDQIMADIGTDHAYLPCWLVKNGRCPGAVASDVAPGPFRRAAQVVSAYGLKDKISVRRGSGLSVLRPEEAATVVLAGMGGQLICDLLQEGIAITSSARRLVLQPQRNPELVRGWLAANGWRIIADDLALDGKMWYNIIAAEPGAMELNEDGLLYGPLTPGVDLALRLEWLCFRRDALLAIIEGLRESRGQAAEARLVELEKEAERLERLMAEVKKC